MRLFLQRVLWAHDQALKIPAAEGGGYGNSWPVIQCVRIAVNGSPRCVGLPEAGKAATRNMRILINGINYHPELTGIGKYTGEMAEWAARNGHEVRVVTAPPYYPAWRLGDGYSGRGYHREELAGVHVVRCPLWVPRVPTGKKRILHLGLFALACAPVMLWEALAWRPDLVLVVEPAVFCAPVAWLSAKVARGRAWLHVQDFEIDAAFGLGLLTSTRLKRLVVAGERLLMRRFQIVSTISARMLNRLEDKGVAASRRLLFPNWVDTEQIHPLGGPSPMRRELSVSQDATVCLYSGNMGQKQGLEILVEAARLLEDRSDIVFLFCGDGAARSRLETLSAGLQNVRFLPLQPLARLNDLLNAADIHLLPQRDDAADLVMPSKLGAMLASGRPVVATARSGTEIAEVVGRYGVVVAPGDGAAFAAAITDLAAVPDRRAELGAAGGAYAAAYLDCESVLRAAFRSVGLDGSS